MMKIIKNKKILFFLAAVILGLAGSQFTLLPIVDYLGISSGEGEIRNGPWVTGLNSRRI